MIQPHTPTKHTQYVPQSYRPLEPCTKYWETLRLHLLENAQKISNFSLFSLKQDLKRSYPARQSYLFLKIVILYTATKYEDI